MRKAKQKIAIVFCSILLMMKPVYAGIPVFDFGEAPSSFKEVSNAMEAVKQTKAQLDELKASLQALGDSLQTIAAFGQDLGDMLAEIQEIADTVCDTLSDTLGIDIDLNEKLADALSQINALQSLLTEDLVDQVTAYVDETTGLIQDIEDTMQAAEDTADAVQTASDIKEFSKDIGNLGEGNFLDKVNVVSGKIDEANGLLNGALDVMESTGVVNVEELREQVNLLNEQQTNLMNMIDNGVENWGEVDLLSEDIEGTLGDLRATLDDLDSMGVDTTEMRNALAQAEDAYQKAFDVAEQVNSGIAAWQELKGELGKVASGEVWDKLKEQYGDDKNFWDVMHDIAANAEDISGDMEKLVNRLEEAGIDTSDIQDILNQTKNANDYVDKGEKGYNDVNEGSKKGRDFLTGKNKKDKGDVDTSVVVEEEEEEVAEDSEDDIETIFNNTKEESSQLIIQLNDTFDEALNNMNKGAALSQSRLTELSEALRALTDEDIDAKDKITLEKRLLELIEHSQKVSDWGVSIAEKAKEKYNREYKDKIVDGINNYQKVVQAYKKGNATKEDVSIAGNVLKREISEINAVPDTAVMVSYKREVGAVIQEARQLSDDIKKAIEDKQKNS